MTKTILYSFTLLLLTALTACQTSVTPDFEVHVWQSTMHIPAEQGVATLYRLPFELNFVVPDFQAQDQRIFRIDYAATINQADVSRFKSAAQAKEALTDSAILIVTDQSGSNQLITGSGFYTGLLFDNINQKHSFRGFRKEPYGLQADLAVQQLLDKSRGILPIRELSVDELHMLFTFVEIDPATGQETTKGSKQLLIKFKDTGN